MKRRIADKYEQLRAHIVQKASLIAKRLEKRPGSRELTNQETALELYAEAVTDPGEITPARQEAIEALHERLTQLDQREMELVRLRYFEAKLWEEIAYEMNLTRAWVDKLHRQVLKKLRPTT